MKALVNFVFLVCLLFAPVQGHAGRLVVVTEHNPPFNFIQDGKVTGIASDLFVEMAEEAGLPVTHDDIQLWPWARGYAEIQHKSDVILFSTGRIEMREGMFQWIGPLYSLDCSIISRKGAHVRINDLTTDVCKYSIGTIRESAPEQVLIAKGVPTANMQRVHDLDINVKKLVEGRIDGVLFNEAAVMYTIKKMGLDTAEYEVNYVLFSVPLYYAASKDMDPAVVGKLQAAFDKLKDEGRLRAIIQEYLD